MTRPSPTRVAPPLADVASWDPTRPLLGGLLSAMEGLACPSLLVVENEARYFGDFTRQPGERLDRNGNPNVSATRREIRPFSLQALLAEQVEETEAFLMALRGARTRHHFDWFTRIPDHRPDPGPMLDHLRKVTMVAGMEWSAPSRVLIHVPMRSAGNDGFGAPPLTDRQRALLRGRTTPVTRVRPTTPTPTV